MNDINISLCIYDMICINNCKDVLQKDITITNTSETICIKCNYLLNIVRVQDNSFTILLQTPIRIHLNLFHYKGTLYNQIS